MSVYLGSNRVSALGGLIPELPSASRVAAVRSRWLRFDPSNRKGLVILGGT